MSFTYCMLRSFTGSTEKILRQCSHFTELGLTGEINAFFCPQCGHSYKKINSMPQGAAGFTGFMLPPFTAKNCRSFPQADAGPKAQAA